MLSPGLFAKRINIIPVVPDNKANIFFNVIFSFKMIGARKITKIGLALTKIAEVEELEYFTETCNKDIAIIELIAPIELIINIVLKGNFNKYNFFLIASINKRKIPPKKNLKKVS